MCAVYESVTKIVKLELPHKLIDCMPTEFCCDPKFCFVNPETATGGILWHFCKRKRMTSKAILCARNQSRTDTSFRTLPPESSASTNSAIRASFVLGLQIYVLFLKLQIFCSLNFHPQGNDVCPSADFEAEMGYGEVHFQGQVLEAGGRPVVAGFQHVVAQGKGADDPFRHANVQP